jgi:tRNA pseudouridine32 synthase / 23S rRNA pseudouridine746 synthase
MKRFEAISRTMVWNVKGMEDRKVMDKLSGGQTQVADRFIVHADPHLLVLDKPAGLLSVPGRGAEKQDCAAARAQRLYPDAQVVHRLDMATSGLLLMARGTEMQRRVSHMFAQRQVQKRYLALVAGRLETPGAGESDWALIDLPLTADWPNRPRQIVDRERGKPSQTRWRVLAHEDVLDATRLELEPVTGRSHQLRVHLHSLGHPILGDSLYAPPAVRDRSPRLLLHACELRLAHPADGSAMHFSSAAPF